MHSSFFFRYSSILRCIRRTLLKSSETQVLKWSLLCCLRSFVEFCLLPLFSCHLWPRPWQSVVAAACSRRRKVNLEKRRQGRGNRPAIYNWAEIGPEQLQHLSVAQWRYSLLPIPLSVVALSEQEFGFRRPTRFSPFAPSSQYCWWYVAYYAIAALPYRLLRLRLRPCLPPRRNRAARRSVSDPRQIM